MKSLSIVASYERVYQEGTSSLRKSNPIPCVRMVRPHNASRAALYQTKGISLFGCAFSITISVRNLWNLTAIFLDRYVSAVRVYARSHVSRTDWSTVSCAVCPEAKWPLWIVIFYDSVPYNLTMHGLTSYSSQKRHQPTLTTKPKNSQSFFRPNATVDCKWQTFEIKSYVILFEYS